VEISAFVGAEIGLHETLVVAVDRAHLAGPGTGDAEVARSGALDRPAFGVDQFRLYSEERLAGRSRLHVVSAGQGGDHHPASLGLPPGVDDRHALLADDPP